MQTRRSAVVPAVLLIGATLFLARDPVLSAIGDFLVVRDDLQPADVIHVISGPDYRADYGIELYKQGYGRRLFFTGGWCSEIQGVHAERAGERALARGVPAAATAADGFQVTSTYAEAARLRQFIDESPHPVRSVIIVSDAFHMRRARWTYQKVLGNDIRVEMAPIPFEQTPFRPRWWADEDSRDFVEHEYLKMAYYLARYQAGLGPLQGWLASLDRD